MSGELSEQVLKDLTLAPIGERTRPFPAWAKLLRDLAFVKTGTPTVILLPEIDLVGELIALLCARERSAFLPLSPDALLGSLKCGDRVRILPDEGIFAFGGTESGGFWLSPLSSRTKGGRFWIPEKEALRLEPTRRKRPLGEANRHDWAPLKPTEWDQFTQCALRGNAALAQLSVVLVGARKDFADALGRLGFAYGLGNIARGVATGLPWGRVDDSGDFELLQPQAASGQPLIAVARDHVSARRLADRYEPGSLLIVSVRPDDALSDRTSVETLAERHSCLVLAPGRVREDFLLRRSENWLVTELSGSPVLKAVPVGIRALDRVVAASGWMGRPPGSFPQRSRELEDAFGQLNDFNVVVAAHSEDDDEVSEAARILQQMFFQASDWLAAPTPEDLEELATDLNALLRLIPRLQSIAGRRAAEAARGIVAALERFVQKVALERTTPKGDCLQRLAETAQMSPSYRQIIVTGQRRTAKTIVAFLEVFGAPMTCVTPVELMPMQDVQRINVLSVMRRESFARLVDPWAAPDIMFLGYKHEVDIYQKRLAMRQRLIDRLRPDASMLAKLPLLAALGATVSQAPLPVSPLQQLEPLASIPRPSRRPELRADEQTRRARFCRFAGRSWMAMTDDHSVARLQTGLGQKAQLIATRCDHLETGDLILVREGGGKDIVREVAEQLAGREAYDRRRRQAGHWRRALQASGHTAEQLRRLLAEEGLERGLPTLRYWMAEEGPIGPSNPDAAIPLIAASLGNNPESSTWKVCCEAIHDVRRWHLGAGSRLTRILMDECGAAILEHSDNETAFKLSVGTVWLLQLEHLERERQPWPYTQVNRIQWESDTWRHRLLRKAAIERPLNPSENLTALIDTAAG